MLEETERLNEGVVGYAFLDVEVPHSVAVAVTVTVVNPDGTLAILLVLLVPGIEPDNTDDVPEIEPEDLVDAALGECVLAEFVLVPLLWERLDPVPEACPEDAVGVGILLRVAEEDGGGAEESQLRTSKATVPLIVMK